jgi:hypothetical protein
MKVQIPTTVFEQLEAIRQSGEINMLDRNGVQVIANNLDFFELVCWIEDNRKDYAEGIFRGFEPADIPLFAGAEED